MPLFLSSEEFQSCSNDAALVAEKADAFIQELMNQLETVKAKADAASITAEQTCSLLEQKYVSLSSEFSSLQSQHSQLNASLEERLTEITELRAQNHQIHLLSVNSFALLAINFFYFIFPGTDAKLVSSPCLLSSLHPEIIIQKDWQGWGY